MLINLQPIPRQNRICTVRNTGSIENEQYFLLECTAYKFLREEFFLRLNRLGINVSLSSLCEEYKPFVLFT